MKKYIEENMSTIWMVIIGLFVAAFVVMLVTDMIGYQSSMNQFYDSLRLEDRILEIAAVLKR